MIATSITYDLIFVIHLMAAVDTLIVFVVMRSAAQSVAHGADDSVQRKRFPNRANWAARVVHVLPITGLIMSLSGDRSVSLSKPWIDVGILCYLAIAGHLEMRTLPLERALATEIEANGMAPSERGRALVRSIDVLLLLIAIALISMLVQY